MGISIMDTDQKRKEEKSDEILVLVSVELLLTETRFI